MAKIFAEIFTKIEREIEMKKKITLLALALVLMLGSVSQAGFGLRKWNISIVDEDLGDTVTGGNFTITIYNAGVAAAGSIYSDEAMTVKTNPVTPGSDAVSAVGRLSFYCAYTSIDVKIESSVYTRTLKYSSVGITTKRLVYTRAQLVKITNLAVPDGGYGLDIMGTIAGATASQGSAIYAHTTLTGDINSHTYNLGSWLDITDGTHAGGAYSIAAIDCGIYTTSDADMGGSWAIGLQIQTMIDAASSPGYHTMMRFNTNQAGDTPDVWFQAANPDCVAFVANAAYTTPSTDKIGAIKIAIVGYGDCYFYIYDHPGQ